MKNAILFLLVLVTVIGCQKSDVQLEPNNPQRFYELPQGSNTFDNDLIHLFNNYQTYFLYKFNVQKDFGWKQTSITGDDIFTNTYSCVQADETYVPKVLNFLTKNWLEFYPDSILKKTLPFKVLFAKDLRRLKNLSASERPLTSTPTGNVLINTVTGFDHITISRFSEIFDTQTSTQLATFKSDIHVEYWNFIMARSKLPLPPGFAATSNYTLTVTTTTMYQNGFLDIYARTQSNPQAYDLRSYVKAIISNTKDNLENTILKSTTDVNGQVRRKYNMIIDFYKTRYGIDLQTIGNTAIRI